MLEPSRGTSEAWAALRVELDHAEMALRSGDAGAALAGARTVGAAVGATPGLRWAARHLEGLALEALGCLDDAVRVLDDVLRRHDVVGSDAPLGASSPEEDRRDWVAAAVALCRCLRLAGHSNEACAVRERVEPVLLAWGVESSTEALKLEVTVAAAYFTRGDLNHAARLCRQALETAEARGDDEARAAALWNTAMIESARGRNDAALVLHREALGLMLLGEDARNVGRLRTAVAWSLLRQQPPRAAEALDQLTQAEHDLRSSSAGVLDLAAALLPRAYAQLELGRGVDARVTVDRLLGLLDDLVEVAGPEAIADALAEAHLVGARLPADVSGEDPDIQPWTHLQLARDWAARSVRAASSQTPDGAPAAGRPGDRSTGELWLAVATVSERLGDLAGAVSAHRIASRMLGRGHALERPRYLTS